MAKEEVAMTVREQIKCIREEMGEIDVLLREALGPADAIGQKPGEEPGSLGAIQVELELLRDEVGRTRRRLAELITRL